MSDCLHTTNDIKHCRSNQHMHIFTMLMSRKTSKATLTRSCCWYMGHRPLGVDTELNGHLQPPLKATGKGGSGSFHYIYYTDTLKVWLPLRR